SSGPRSFHRQTPSSPRPHGGNRISPRASSVRRMSDIAAVRTCQTWGSLLKDQIADAADGSNHVLLRRRTLDAIGGEADIPPAARAGRSAIMTHSGPDGTRASPALVHQRRSPRSKAVRAQPAASLTAVSKLFESKAGILWIRPRRWVEYQTENASMASGFGASTMSTKS